MVSVHNWHAGNKKFLICFDGVTPLRIAVQMNGKISAKGT
jgi:hypothetical protein